MKFTQHPLSAAFPAMSAEEFESLKDSILEVGVLNPIVILDGMVLDGWHRYTAASEVGMDCPSVELGDVDPQDFVMAQNKARRHITIPQLIAAASKVYQWRPNGGNQSALSAECISSKALAEKVGAGVRSVEQFRKVERDAAPEVKAAIQRGEIGLPKAAAIAKLPQAEQAAAINKPLPKPAPSQPNPEPEAPPDYTELDADKDAISVLSEENDRLNDRLAIAAFEATDEERNAAHETLIALRAENKTLIASLRAVTLSRDALMSEVAQLKKQCQMQRRELEKAKASA